MAFKFKNPWGGGGSQNPWDINGAEAQKVLGVDSISLPIQEENNLKIETDERILTLLSYYSTSLQDSFEEVNTNTTTNKLEYGFNILASYNDSISGSNFLDKIKNYSIIASDVYTSQGETHIYPRMDDYVEGSEDFVFGNDGNQMFLGFIHSHPDANGKNICFSAEDLSALLILSVVVFKGNRFTDSKEMGKYFVFFVECPSNRFALIISDATKARVAYNDAVAFAKKTLKDLPENASGTTFFKEVIRTWYYIDGNSPYNNSSYLIDVEKKSEETLKYVLRKLGQDCGVVLYKSLKEDKNIFQQL